MTMNMRTMYGVLGGAMGDKLAGTYRTMLEDGTNVDLLGESLIKVIQKVFKTEIKQYSDFHNKNEMFVAAEIVEELRTYHYL